MKKLLSVIVAIIIMIPCGTVAFAVTAGTVETLDAVRSGSFVNVSGTTENVNAAVAVQVLDADGSVIGMTSIVVSENAFTGSVSFSGTPAKVRAADFDGGPWKTVELPAEHHGSGIVDERYSIQLGAADNGTVELSAKKASAGQTVTVTAAPDEGYFLKSVAVTDENGNEIALNDLGEGKYSFEMPGADVSVEVVFAQRQGYSVCLCDDTCLAGRFTDVDVTAWYHDGIHFCVENGIMKGVTETKFDTAGDITRAQLITMLWRLDGEKYVNYEMTFLDVPEGQWYTDAVRWAKSTGVAGGYSADYFGPGDGATREQVASILYNYAKLKGQGFTGAWMFLLDFADRADISDWANEAVHWCSMKGIVNGRTENDSRILDPKSKATRAAAAAMIQRFCESFEE